MDAIESSVTGIVEALRVIPGRTPVHPRREDLTGIPIVIPFRCVHSTMGDEELPVREELADLDLPSPRDDAIASIDAAYAYIDTHGGGTKAEIIDAIEPEANHRIGLRAGQMIGKLNLVDEYREWWWDNVASPGFRALPEVQAVGDGRWYTTVDQADLETGRREPDSEVSNPDRTQQAKALRDEAGVDPDSVELDDLQVILSDPMASPAAHGIAADALRSLAAQREEVGGRFVEPIVRLLDRPALDADETLLWCLRELATNDPEAVFAERETVSAYVTAEPGPENRAALSCCVELLDDDAGAFVELVPTLAALLEHGPSRTAKYAAYTLAQIAKEEPSAIRPVVDRLLGEVDELSPQSQMHVLIALGRVSSLVDDVEPLVRVARSLTEADDDKVRGNATALLADASDAAPTAVDATVAIAMLDDSDPHVRVNAATIVLNVARETPTACADAVDPLIELLDDPDGAARRNASKALGHIGAEEPYDALQSKAMFDPDAGVRAAADWAMKELV